MSCIFISCQFISSDVNADLYILSECSSHLKFAFKGYISFLKYVTL